MRNLRTVMRKELTQLRRDPRLIGFVIFSPLLFLFLFGVALKLQFENVPLAVVDQDRTYLAMHVKDALWRQPYFVVSEVESLDAMRARLDAGEARIGVHIPAEFSESLFAGETATVRIYTDGTMPTVAIAMEANADEALGADFQRTLVLDEPDAERREPPRKLIEIETVTLYNEDLRDAAFFLPGVIGILVLQVGLVLASAAIVREKEYRTMEQLLAVPLERAQIILGKLLPYALIAFVDFVIILGAGIWVFDLPFAGSAALLIALTAVYVVTILSLGLLISTLAETQQQAIFFSLFILLPSILLSGFVFPIEAMPAYIQPLSALFPLTHYLVIIRGIMLKGVGMGLLWNDLAGLLVLGGLSLGVATLRFRKQLGD